MKPATGHYEKRDKKEFSRLSDKDQWMMVNNSCYDRKHMKKSKGKYYDYHIYMKGLVKANKHISGDKKFERIRSPNKAVNIDQV